MNEISLSKIVVYSFHIPKLFETEELEKLSVIETGNVINLK